MLRVFVISALLLLQSCSVVSRVSVYPLRIAETPTLNLKLTDRQVRQKLETAYTRWHATPYRFGHQVPGLAADCSGFTQSVFKNQLSVALPRTTRAQINLGQTVSIKQAKAGDLVFFNLNNGYGHVGIYLDNNVVIQATTSKGVTKTDLSNNKWWADRVFKVKRVIN